MHSHYISPKVLKSLPTPYFTNLQHVLRECACLQLKEPVIVPTFIHLNVKFCRYRPLDIWHTTYNLLCLCDLKSLAARFCYVLA